MSALDRGLRRRQGVVIALAAIFVSGCAVGPDFKVPAAPDTTGYTKGPLPARTASADTALGEAQRFQKEKDISGTWWQLFHSRALNSLIEKSLEANPTLQSAIAALRVAKFGVYAQEGHYFPTVQANYNPTRQETASDLSPVLNNNLQSQNPFNLFTAQVMVSYTPDVWGLNRRTVESLQAQADNQRFAVEAAWLTLTSNIVVAAIQEASLRGQIEATHRIIDINKKMLDVMRKQFETGYANRSDLAAQEAALAQVEATLPPLERQLAIQRDLLTALAGRLPSDQPSETFRLADMKLPVDLPVSLPSKLIEQRPDVRQAEESLHAASAQVGVAIANILPNFTITGNRGYTAVQMANLISSPNIFWNVAGNATQTLFDGFTLINQARAASAGYDQAAWSYRNAVIAALQNVADTLAALETDATALKAARNFERAAKISLDLAQQQMQTGNANVLLLLTAQQTYLQAVIQVVQAQANRLSDTAALFQALGGGWWNRDRPPATVQTFDVSTGRAQPLKEDESKGWPEFRWVTHVWGQ
ncbi:MAG TPA: efflux transporter outer membrane subunit [Xanthobacteraceae bacterium]|nr:efflux transporter outer membrane subunit [Xanthobacteraceae bacterium]